MLLLLGSTLEWTANAGVSHIYIVRLVNIAAGRLEADLKTWKIFWGDLKTWKIFFWFEDSKDLPSGFEDLEDLSLGFEDFDVSMDGKYSLNIGIRNSDWPQSFTLFEIQLKGGYIRISLFHFISKELEWMF